MVWMQTKGLALAFNLTKSYLFSVSQRLVKEKLQVNGSSSEECAKIYGKHSSIHLSHKLLCACGEDGSGTCNGDSGSPLMAEHHVDGNYFNYLVGIVSFGPKEWFVFILLLF